MKQKRKLPTRIIQAVQIERVRLLEATVKTRVTSRKDIGEAMFVVGDDARVARFLKEDGTFVVIATVDARVVPTGARDRSPAVSIRASYELTYTLPKGFDASPRELSTFARTNGVFNAWPYWREFIQNAFARMDLPQPVLPVYLIQSSPPESRRKELGETPASAEQETSVAEKSPAEVKS